MSAEREQLKRVSRVIRLKHIYRQGVVTNVLNPMVALFSLSFLPQFVYASVGSVTLQTLVPGVIFNVNGTLILILITLPAGQWLATKGTLWK